MRHRSVERIDDEKHTIDHAQDALNFATEVGVAGRVDDVDLRVVPVNARILGKDGDAAFPLERVRVHHAFLNDLIFAECTALAEHLVDEGRLPVVDVGDDGDVANLHSPVIYWGLEGVREAEVTLRSTLTRVVPLKPAIVRHVAVHPTGAVRAIAALAARRLLRSVQAPW